MSTIQSDSELDLVFERIAPVTPKQLWDAWTQPEQLKQWFTPAPWKTVECQIDLQPGGNFRTVMQSPEGNKFDNHGCYIEIVKEKRLTWTNTMSAGFRPASAGAPGFAFTAIITFEPHGPSNTKYKAVVLHNNKDDRNKHEQMGFQDGWGKAYEQLLDMARRINK